MLKAMTLSVVAMTISLAVDIKPVPFTKNDSTIQATTKSGNALLGVREMVVD
jgi:hypothetical protein